LNLNNQADGGKVKIDKNQLKLEDKSKGIQRSADLSMADIAMLSFANFGASRHPVCERARHATAIVKDRRPDLMIDGEVQVDPALDPSLMAQRFPFSTLKGEANVLIFPDLASGNIAYKLMGRFGGAHIVGPILLGLAKPINVLQYGTDTRGIVNLVALTTLKAQGAW